MKKAVFQATSPRQWLLGFPALCNILRVCARAVRERVT